MFDKNGKEITVGAIMFYSERPYSNYADSLVEVYEHGDDVRVGTLVLNDLSGAAYMQHHHDPANDLLLSDYGLDYASQPTDKSENLEVIDGLTADEATIEYAEKNYPLSRRLS